MCYPKHKQILHKDDSVHSVIAKVFFNWKLGINHGKITSLKKIYNNHNKRNQMEYFKHQPKGSCYMALRRQKSHRYSYSSCADLVQRNFYRMFGVD